MTDRLSNMVGLSMRAGKLESGALPVEKALSAGKAKLVLLDEGMSENSLKKYVSSCGIKNITVILLKPGVLSAAIGRERLCAAVTDEGFTKSIIKLAIDAGLHIFGGVTNK